MSCVSRIRMMRFDYPIVVRASDQKEEFFSQKSIPPHKSPNLESLLRYYRVPANRMTAQKRDSNDIPRTFPQPFHREQ